MSTFSIKIGDTLPKLSASLRQNNKPIDLTDCSVQLRLYSKATKELVLDRQCTVVSEFAGTVEYQWVAGDTSDAQDLSGEFVITYANLDVLTVPTTGNFTVSINPRVA